MKFVLHRGMPTVVRTVRASPEEVWKVLVDLNAWPSWGPTVAGAKSSDDGPLALGSRGEIRTPLGVWLPFTITEFEAGRYWKWEVAGISATRHAVEPTTGGCRVAFSAPWWVTAYLPVCAIAVERIARMAE